VPWVEVEETGNVDEGIGEPERPRLGADIPCEFDEGCPWDKIADADPL
jgi:hypothetical protein